MKFILKLIIYPLVFVYLLFVFLPKTSLYYEVENVLLKNKIILSDEKISDNIFGITLRNSKLYYDGIYMASIKKLNFNSFLFFSSFNVNNLTLSNNFSSYFPAKTSKINISHSILNPLILSIKSKGEFGHLSGTLNLLKKTLIINIHPSNKLKNNQNIMGQLRLEKNGSYNYEYKY